MKTVHLLVITIAFCHGGMGEDTRPDGGWGDGGNLFVSSMANIANLTMNVLFGQLSRAFGDTWSSSAQSDVNDELLIMCPDIATQMFCLPRAISNPTNLARLVQVAFNSSFERFASSGLDWTVDPGSLDQTASYFIESLANNLGVQLDPSSFDYVYDELETLCPDEETRADCLENLPDNPDGVRQLEEAAFGEIPQEVVDRINAVLDRVLSGDGNIFEWFLQIRSGNNLNETMTSFFNRTSSMFGPWFLVNMSSVMDELHISCPDDANWVECLRGIFATPGNLTATLRHIYDDIFSHRSQMEDFVPTEGDLEKTIRDFTNAYSDQVGINLTLSSPAIGTELGKMCPGKSDKSSCKTDAFKEPGGRARLRLALFREHFFGWTRRLPTLLIDPGGMFSLARRQEESREAGTSFNIFGGLIDMWRRQRDSWRASNGIPSSKLDDRTRKAIDKFSKSAIVELGRAWNQTEFERKLAHTCTGETMSTCIKNTLANSDIANEIVRGVVRCNINDHVNDSSRIPTDPDSISNTTKHFVKFLCERLELDPILISPSTVDQQLREMCPGENSTVKCLNDVLKNTTAVQILSTEILLRRFSDASVVVPEESAGLRGLLRWANNVWRSSFYRFVG